MPEKRLPHSLRSVPRPLAEGTRGRPGSRRRETGKRVPNETSMNGSQQQGGIRQVAATVLPTRWGVFRMFGFERQGLRPGPLETAVVLILGDPASGVPL